MYEVDVLIQGFPGKAVCHGGLGWSTVTLLRTDKRMVLVDVGAFGVRRELSKQLRARNVDPAAITDVVLTHAHYDHSVNFTLFPNATVWIGEEELAWASSQAPGFDPLPELYVRELSASERVRRVAYDKEFLPGLKALASPGHTPGHLLFYLTGNPVPILFTGDAGKNRAELLSGHVDAAEDFATSEETLRSIWNFWRAVPGTILIPGHDFSMTLDDAAQPQYFGERRAAISAWFAEDLELTTMLDLCPRSA
jgi:N-acyl homoserine lactone hydrolase